MTNERLDKKFKELLECRGELKERQDLQEDAIIGSEKVMEIFKHRFTDGKKVREIKMYYNVLWSDNIIFLVKAPDGRFYREHQSFSQGLKEALEVAGDSVDGPILAKVLRILGEYFEISEEGIIRI